MSTLSRFLLHLRNGVCLVAFSSMMSLPVVKAETPIQGLGPVGEVRKLPGTFEFTEGPAFDGKRYLYFTDIPASRIMRLDTSVPTATPEEFIKPSMMCNGLMIDGVGKLVACRMETGEVVAFDLSSKQAKGIATNHDGKRFNACNDLVIDRTGGVYFTDPRFRAPEPWPQGKEAVYYRSAKGEIKRVADGFDAPNGVILSPDEKLLYVIPSMASTMVVFDVTAPGVIENRRPFCELAQAPGQSGKGGDGLTIDVQGNLYITSALGLQVFSPAGKQLGIIPIPEQPANVTFGGADMSTPYVTARKGLYAVPMSIRGHQFSGTVP